MAGDSPRVAIESNTAASARTVPAAQALRYGRLQDLQV